MLVIERQGKEQTVYATLAAWRSFTATGPNFRTRSAARSATARRLSARHPARLGAQAGGMWRAACRSRWQGGWPQYRPRGRVESYALPASIVRETVDRLLQPQLTSAAATAPPAEPPKPSGQER
jgi:hypothetical protein